MDENENLTLEDYGMLELVFLQLAHDEMGRLFSLDGIREDRTAFIERKEVQEAFSSSFRALKRSMTYNFGEKAYTDTLDMMADIADELEAYVNIIYYSYTSLLCNKITYKDYEPMARMLTLTTLIRISNIFYMKALNKPNKRTVNIIKKIAAFSDKFKIKMFATSKLEFDTTEVAKQIKNILNTALKKTREYENKVQSTVCD
jgi:hypothetical protein